jgi:hypothetical protein
MQKTEIVLSHTIYENQQIKYLKIKLETLKASRSKHRTKAS